jgi:hypothetical protein
VYGLILLEHSSPCQSVNDTSSSDRGGTMWKETTGTWTRRTLSAERAPIDLSSLDHLRDTDRRSTHAASSHTRPGNMHAWQHPASHSHGDDTDADAARPAAGQVGAC